MKKTPTEWLAKITATRKQEGSDKWFTAHCQICGESKDATVLSSDSSAVAAAKGKVLTHIRMTHKEHVDDTTTAA